MVLIQMVFNKIIILIMIQTCFILTAYGCSQPSKFEIVTHDEKAVSVFELEVPEPWFKNKTTTSYIRANGVFVVKRIRNGNALLFKLSDSKNVYRWNNGSITLVEASLSDWENAMGEMSIYSHNVVTDPFLDQKIVRNFVQLRNINPTGEKRYMLRKGPDYYDMISFTGKIKAGRKGIVTGQDSKYKGTAFLEVYSANNKPILSIKRFLKGSQSALFPKSFWYDGHTLLVPVPDDNYSTIIISKFKINPNVGG